MRRQSTQVLQGVSILIRRALGRCPRGAGIEPCSCHVFPVKITKREMSYLIQQKLLYFSPSSGRIVMTKMQMGWFCWMFKFQIVFVDPMLHFYLRLQSRDSQSCEVRGNVVLFDRIGRRKGTMCRNWKTIFEKTVSWFAFPSDL